MSEGTPIHDYQAFCRDSEIAPTGRDRDSEIAPTGRDRDSEIAPTRRGRDSEIAPTEEMSNYFYNPL